MVLPKLLLPRLMNLLSIPLNKLPCVSNMFDAQTVIRIFLILSGLDVNPAVCGSNPFRFRIFNDGRTTRLSLDLKGFGMSSHFQNVVLFWNTLSFSKCERFCECFFPFSEKHNCKQTFINKNLFSHYKLLYGWGCVKKQRNIFKAFEFVSVVKNL